MPNARKTRMAGVTIAIVLALCAAGGGTIYAAQDSLPGDALYQVKLGTEQAMMQVGDDVAKAERALSFAERRVREMEALAEGGRLQDLALAVEKYGYAVSTTVAEMKRARNRGPDAENITARVAEVLARHLMVFDQLWDMVPEEAKAAIACAMNVSETGWENSLVVLAMSDTVHAAEMNLAAMEGRLNRTRTRVQDPEALQIALQQFGDMAGLVQEISQIAGEMAVNVAEVAELVTESTSRHLEVLAEVYEEVPEDAKDAVEWAMERSFRGYEEITMVLMGSGVGEAQLPVIPDGIRQRMEDILGWTNAPKIRMPTGGFSGQGCPSCRH